MELRFHPPTPLDPSALLQVFARVGQDWTGARVQWTLEHLQEVPDPNGLPEPCFRARWTAPGLTLEGSTEPGEGHPRDGWSYRVRWHLAGPDGATCALKTEGSSPSVYAFHVVLGGQAPERVLHLRQTLRDGFGPHTDRTAEPAVARHLILALAAAGRPDLARDLAREALQAPLETWGREEILRWMAGSSPQEVDLARRLQESPCDLEAWREALQKGVPHLEGTAVREGLARLCPFDPEERARAGFGSAPWFAHPLWPGPPSRGEPGTWYRLQQEPDVAGTDLVERVSRDLTGWSTGADWRVRAGEAVPSPDPRWRLLVERHARWSEGQLVARVCLHAGRREPHEWSLAASKLSRRRLREIQLWEWICGSGEDAVCLVRREILEKGRMVLAAVAWTCTGSSPFRARVWSTLQKVTPGPWEACAPGECLEPRPRPG